MAESSELPAGLYESLLTAGLQRRLSALPSLTSRLEAVDEADQPHVLARQVYEETLRHLSSLGTEDARLELANSLLQGLPDSPDPVLSPVEQLHRLTRPSTPGQIDYEHVRPTTPLSEAALLTNSRGEPNLNSELKAEIDTADQVDLLCAFVKWHGVRLL